MLYLFLVST